MFTGIIESQGRLVETKSNGGNKTMWFHSSLAGELKPDQSLSHNGVCLTVEETSGLTYRVTAVPETLSKTNLGTLKEGDLVNLERCLLMNGRLDGHLVQGHVDTTGKVNRIRELDGSWEFSFSYPAAFESFIIEKGSICVNGISLTAFQVENAGFSVAVIPYTYQHTNINKLAPGSPVNLEFDMIGKYVSKLLSRA